MLGRRVWVPSALGCPQEDHGAVLGTNHCPTLPYSNTLDTLSLQSGQLPAVKAPHAVRWTQGPAFLALPLGV